MNIFKFAGKHGACNTYILISGNQAAVIDPSADISEILKALGECELKYILLTHGHFDHIFTLDNLRKQTGAPLFIHRGDSEFLIDAELNASSLLTGFPITSSPADSFISDGDILPLGNESIKVISTPGHTEGSVCLDCGDILITGDTLFDSSYGRYDLPGGDPYKLAASLRMLADRNDDPMIYPGHGASCSLACADYIAYFRKKL